MATVSMPENFELVWHHGTALLRYIVNGVSIWYAVANPEQLDAMGLMDGRHERARHITDDEYYAGVAMGHASDLWGQTGDLSQRLLTQATFAVNGNEQQLADPHIFRLALSYSNNFMSREEFDRRYQDSAYYKNLGPGAAPPTPGGQPPGGASTAENQSAKALITSTLASYGLQSLGDWMWAEYQKGVPLEAIWLEMRERPEYQARFPGMKELSAKGRAISEAQYIDYERSAVQIMRAAGIPSGVMDSREKIGGMIGGEVSLKEFEDRLSDYQVAVFQSPQEVRDQLRQYYGVQEGDMLAFFLDEEATLPLLQKRWMAAQAGGTAVSSGYGSLQKAEAERLAELGLDRNQLVSGFSTLHQSRELFHGLPGTQEDVIDKDTQFGAVFEGRSADAERVKRRAETRAAAFGGGGGFASGRGGITGTGSAR